MIGASKSPVTEPARRVDEKSGGGEFCKIHTRQDGSRVARTGRMVNEGAIAKVAVYRVEGAGLSEQADGCQPAREDAAKKSQGILCWLSRSRLLEVDAVFVSCRLRKRTPR
jgi:hypothetical protein